MAFTSPFFLFFFLPLLLLLYWVSPSLRWRNSVLLVFSLWFYSISEGRFFVALILLTAGNYLFGVGIGGARSCAQRKLYLLVAVVLNLSLLIHYKYWNFVLGIFSSAGNGHPIFLPAGISFLVFHSISYLVDVYRGDASAQRSLPRLFLYISFFPQLISGPIVRYHEVIGYLGSREENRNTVAYGIQRFLLGLAKKTLLADSLGPVADQIFGLDSNALTGPLAWIGIFTYGMQIYLDFSGYSDMALGLAAIFGIKFPENFNYPYVATSITDFWRRWHISLSNWFRDYLYIPLGGNRVAPWRNYLNLITVFFLCGLWHGANWTFIAWGLAHGIMLMAEKALGPDRISRIPSVLRRAYTLAFVFLAWVVFRSNNIDQALSFYRAALGFDTATVNFLPLASIINLELILVSFLSVMVATPVLSKSVSLETWGDYEFPRRNFYYRYAYSAVLLLLTLASFSSLSAKTFKPFIYFKF